jgi:hypothetical protein
MDSFFLIKILKFINLKIYTFRRIFSFYGEEFEDVEPEGFDLQAQTIHCSNVSHDQIIQVKFRFKLQICFKNLS